MYCVRPVLDSHRPIALKKRGMGNQEATEQPGYALRRGMGVWQLTFAGADAVLKHEQGILYVAHLLYQQPPGSVHGLELAASATRPCGGVSGIRVGAGIAMVEKHAYIQERSCGLDEAESWRALRRKEQELEALLDDEDQPEPIKAEAQRELETLAEYQRQHGRRHEDNAQRAVRAVRRALYRFHSHLLEAVDTRGHPHPVLRPFAEHIEKHILIPSARFSGRRAWRASAGLAGCFTYEAPAGITWAR